MKRVVSLVLVLIMLMSLSVTSFANESIKTIEINLNANNQEQEVILNESISTEAFEQIMNVFNSEKNETSQSNTKMSEEELDVETSNLIDEISNLYFELEGEKDSDKKLQIEEEIKNCELLLEIKYGVNCLDDKELSVLFPAEEISTDKGRSSTAPTTPTSYYTSWYCYGPYTRTSNGNDYDVYILQASPKKTSSDLHASYLNTTIKDEENFDLDDLATIYLQKAIGLVPFVSWTPYELLFPSGEPYDTGYAYQVDYIIKTKQRFYYVAGEMSVSSTLVINTTQVDSNCNHEFEYFDNNLNLISPDDVMEYYDTVSGDHYMNTTSSLDYAVNRYTNSYYTIEYPATSHYFRFDGVSEAFDVPFELYPSGIN